MKNSEIRGYQHSELSQIVLDRWRTRERGIPVKEHLGDPDALKRLRARTSRPLSPNTYQVSIVLYKWMRVSCRLETKIPDAYRLPEGRNSLPTSHIEKSSYRYCILKKV